MDFAEVQSTYTALSEAGQFAARGDTTRSYGFVTDHSLSLGWKPLRIKAPFGSFDSTTGAAYVILEGAFFRQDHAGVMWQRSFTLVLNSATCDGTCGGIFTETIHFTDFPMLFGSIQQASAPNATVPHDAPQQVPLKTVERIAPKTYAAAVAGKATQLPPPIVITPCRPPRPGQPRPVPISEAPASTHSVPKKPAFIVVTPCRAPRQKPEERAATVKPQVSEGKEELRAAMGSPVVDVPSPKEAQLQQSQPSAGSESADKCSLVNILDQETEVSSTNASSTATRNSSPTTVLRNNRKITEEASKSGASGSKRLRPNQKPRSRRQRCSQRGSS